MTSIKINEQIAFLRKEHGLTQEALAQRLGVSNQAVSKWEAGACCPDIQLLPQLAETFGVSVDELIGYKPAVSSDDLLLDIRNIVNELSAEDADRYTFRLAACLHTVLFAKRMIECETACWNAEDAIKHAGNSDWGYSCLNVPDITTVMRGGAVFFSSNENLSIKYDASAHIVSSTLKAFSDARTVKTAHALHALTYKDENSFVSADDIAKHCRLGVQTVNECLLEGLMPFLCLHEENGVKLYRFEGKYMNLVPMISLFDIR